MARPVLDDGHERVRVAADEARRRAPAPLLAAVVVLADVAGRAALVLDLDARLVPAVRAALDDERRVVPGA